MCKYTLIQEEQRAALAHVETVMWTKAPFYIKTVENIFFHWNDYRVRKTSTQTENVG